ncbi:hypothetical protein VTJ83DRAFT_1351 [Remersonia thermophila]|uniref:Zn(2)-C6 fungal-type domain-containing protein n=1 Tax=Remersonia thermophila TaxID=72144 RepID=A0ABR4DPG6_9PEZI
MSLAPPPQVWALKRPYPFADMTQGKRQHLSRPSGDSMGRQAALHAYRPFSPAGQRVAMPSQQETAAETTGYVEELSPSGEETDSTDPGQEASGENRDSGSDTETATWNRLEGDLNTGLDRLDGLGGLDGSTLGGLDSWLRPPLTPHFFPLLTPELPRDMMTQVTPHYAGHTSSQWAGQHGEASFPNIPAPTPATGSVAIEFDLGPNWDVIQNEELPLTIPEQPSSLNSSHARFFPGAISIRSEPPRQNTRPNSEGVSKTTDLQFVEVDPTQCKTGSATRRRGPFNDPQRQAETAKTRGLKACVRCQMQKIRCQPDPNHPAGICLTCKNVSKPTLHTLECRRWRLAECTLYRKGKPRGLEFTLRWSNMTLANITDWESPDVRVIDVESTVCPVPLRLHVRKFKPLKGKDATHKTWVDKTGIRKFKPTTPYAIVNMKDAAQHMKAYIAKYFFASMECVLKGRDQWVVETYSFAQKYICRVESEEEKKLLKNFFRLWFAIRRTSTVEHIVGNDTLDMQPETEDESFPLFGKVPLPPVMIYQLDAILTLGVLDPLRKQVLEDFQKLVQTANPNNWMTVYLITFMLLHSCSMITHENYNNARKHGLRRRYSMPNFISEHHQSANVILHHYHYRTESCNPFKQDWTQRHRTPFANMSPEDIMFLERTKELLAQRESIIKKNKEIKLYEHELYFVAQMFEQGWSPRDTVIEDMGEVVMVKKYAGEVEESRN